VIVTSSCGLSRPSRETSEIASATSMPDVADAISEVSRDGRDRPHDDVTITRVELAEG